MKIVPDDNCVEVGVWLLDRLIGAAVDIDGSSGILTSIQHQDGTCVLANDDPNSGPVGEVTVKLTQDSVVTYFWD